LCKVININFDKLDNIEEKMSDKECTICKHYGIRTENPDSLEKEQIYDEVGTPVTIMLCRKHSVDLFRNGQRKFLVQHYKILVDIISSDEVKFLDILERTVRDNLDDIY
tara:strand:+ start:375 stop:701 length:327 start_codon:yes stop_codon:yes gene_type:complete